MDQQIRHSVPAQNPGIRSSEPEPDVLYLNLIWHQHQPLYYADSKGVITRPWVRVHGTKDYYDMAATVAKYPDVHVTFNLTPVLINQIDDFVFNGAKDRYWVLSEKPANHLTDEEKEFILTRFFDANWDHMIRIHPGYARLLEKRGGVSTEDIAAAMKSFTNQDFLDLQIWFNLAWMDPDLLAAEPLKQLVEKNQNFIESDKAILFQEVKQIMAEIIPLHRELQEAGQIEVITSPLAHPILPLLYDTNLALTGNPGADMPDRFQYVQDAIAQLELGRQIYIDHFGKEPLGLWPSEGAVAPEIVPLVSNTGYHWMASGEQVLANSLGLGAFRRDGKDTLLQADQFYRPYWVAGPKNGPIPGEKMIMVFRDNLISDKLGFTYSGTPGEKASTDFMNRLENIRQELKIEGATGPHLVTIILDGENAWENYDQDGKVFLNSLYRQLSESKTVKTTTVTDYLKQYPDQQDLPNLFPGAWFSANYDTWIGEPEEKNAWNLLGAVREHLQQKILEQQKTGKVVTGLQDALQQMYLAEGSDWFWWYGADQDSGNDAYFDEGYRALLSSVYSALGEDIPQVMNVPIIPAQLVLPDRDLTGLMPGNDKFNPQSDWTTAALYEFTQSDKSIQPIKGLLLGVDPKNINISFESTGEWKDLAGAKLSLYFASPQQEKGSGVTRVTNKTDQVQLLGFSATRMVELDPETMTMQPYLPTQSGWQSQGAPVPVNILSNRLFGSIPLALFGKVQAGDEIKFRLEITKSKDNPILEPVIGPGRIILPDFSSMTTLLDITDPIGDDNGPGSYTSPSDPVFQEGVFDVTKFKVRYDEQNVSFDFTIAGDITNPWNGPAGYSLQTFDVYVDMDPEKSTGARMLLPGRNAALEPGYGWDVAIWSESWTPQIYASAPGSLQPIPISGVEMKVLLDLNTSTFSIRIPRSVFGVSDPQDWAVAAMILSQEGYPSDGVWRVRDIEKSASQWKFGGAPSDLNHTRIIDIAWIEGSNIDQHKILSNYPPLTVTAGALAEDDYARIPMLQKAP